MWSAKELDEYNKFIPQLYEAAISPELWCERLDCLAGMLQTQNAIIMHIENIRPEISEYSFHANSWVPGEAIAEYLSLGLNQNDGSAYFHQQDLYDFSVGDEVRHSNGDTTPSRFYPWLEKTTGCNQAAGMCVSKDAAGYDILTVHYRDDGLFEPTVASDKLRFIGPHLTKVLEMNRPVHLLRHRYGAFLDVLDRLRIGVAILNANGEIVIINEEFTRILDSKDALTVGAGQKLTARDDQDARRLSQAVQKLGRMAFIEKSSENLRLNSRINESSAYLLDLAPLREKHGTFGGQFTGVLATVVDPFWYTDINTDLLNRHFALTRTETDVFDAVLRGLSNSEIADHLGKGPETVKSQLASVYRKTGVKDRLELVRLAVQMIIPLREDQIISG
ncbi:MAG: LuxR C-terminal-related transcriptional regulator [Pseudomonadota bacterium]|nr:LuxR C-terminal-related transcriptional regulator [Pseudomonadota bacterium]